MAKCKLDKTTGNRGRCFLIYGRALPTEKCPQPQVVCTRIYAANAVLARSKFWKLNLTKFGLRKSKGELLRVQEVFESGRTIAKNFGIFLKYRSTVGVHNVFKEYRDTTINGAINQMYDEMGGNHRISRERIDIISVSELAKEQLRERKPRALIFADAKAVKYPLWKRTARPTNPKFRATFHTSRPCVMKTGKSVTN